MSDACFVYIVVTNYDKTPQIKCNYYIAFLEGEGLKFNNAVSYSASYFFV